MIMLKYEEIQGLFVSFQEEDVTKVELLRLALARNLAMAIVKEGTVEACC